ncbi:uncharacterized protein LOC134532816 isoform X3 [Bacillus rossius redtenbacheri]|uniref:uncharacterized protein LOC134532816 isoform X3 n=1 Tax=Bacillus rossius redtenbacheri TaxID=93214 RepID=UPI002FDD1A37
MPGSSGPSSPARAAVTVSPYRDRRASTSSDTSDTSTASRQLSIDGVEVIPTRLSKVTASKPAANPLQFVKVGPCNLYRAAQETLKKVEEVKKIKEEVQNQEEDWQSNLDNWKSSRRKRQEHIIERVVEVKKLEMEEFDRNRRRSKTFNEMLEERNKTGRKMSLAVYKDEDANDLSDLGIGTHSSKSSISEEYGHDDNHLDNYSEDSRESTGRCVFDNHNGEAPKNGLNGHHDDDTSTTATISSPEPEEYTYERAIQGYVNFAENRAKTRAAKTNILNNINGNFDHGEHTGNETSKNNNCVNLPNRSSKKIPPPVVPRRQSAAKIEDRLTALEQRRSSQLSDVGTCESGNKVTVPKVDILKRRELFEKASDVDSQSSRQDRISGDFSNAKSIRERLSHLEKQNEENANIKERQILSSQVSSTVKERLSHFDRSTENLFEKGSTKSVLRLSNGDISSQTLRDRLSSLERSASLEREGSASSASRISEEVPHTIKERLSNLDSARNRVVHKVTPDRDVSFHSKLATFQSSDKSNAGSPECSLTPDDKLYQGKQQFHRSLDSLEVEGSCGAVENLSSFERVQSLEDVDCFGNDRNYPASTSSTEMLVFSTQSGDTDREDSGIHTADVSCSVSQADEPVEEGEATVSAPHLEPILDSYQESSETLCLGTKEPVEITQEHPQTSDTPSSDDAALASMADAGAGSPEPQGPRPAAGETIEDSGSAEGLRGEAEGETAAAGEVVSDDSGVQISPYPSLLDKPTSEDEMFFPLIDSQIPPLVLSADIEVVAGLEFPLGPPTSAEPPKEKPPPPPVDLSDEDVPPPVTSLKRLDSTKRIKKEIRRKRSDFLGIEGSNDDSYLEPELKVAPPPDMTLFLVEERRSEQQLYRQSICSESDSALGETTDSRDSGVELDRGHLDDASWSGRPVLTPSSEHSRQDSELYGNASTTSEEEIMKREREIVETVEKEDQWHYKNTHAPNEQSGIGEKLAEKLRLLEQEKMRLEWEQVEEDRRLRAKEAELRQQEKGACEVGQTPASAADAGCADQLRAERERLQQENQALELQKQQLQMQQRWDPTHRSLQDVSSLPVGQQPLTPLCLPPITETPPNYRLSLPNLQDVGSPAVSSPTRRPPPPIPPAKPLRPDRDATIRSSRVPSADSLPQQMSRHTLQALSAAPRSRFISTDTWMQAKRKPDAPRSNYQHWLVQEAEHRRITEQQQRNARSPRRLLAPVPPQPVPRSNKPLPDAIIQTLTQRVQNRAGLDKAPSAPQRRSPAKEQAPPPVPPPPTNLGGVPSDSQEKMLSVSGKKKCSHCGEELGRGAAMIIESLRLFYHIDCFKCCVCHVQLGDGLMGTDVRVRNNKLHCHNCYSSDDGVKFSCV